MPVPGTAVASARAGDRLSCGPEIRAGPRRSRSGSGTRSPGGTAGGESGAGRRPPPVFSVPYGVSHSHWFTASRTGAIGLAGVVALGEQHPPLSRAAAASDDAFGPSPVVAARAPAHPRGSPSAVVNSRRPRARWGFRARSSRVFSRSPHVFGHRRIADARLLKEAVHDLPRHAPGSSGKTPGARACPRGRSRPSAGGQGRVSGAWHGSTRERR
ncbi:hypothetical protein AB0F39_33945 [Streptomyces murinus]|uniref:hypothetical protein n=1 Tax=Streptomyces murinus TaxID=33900 RepID=UPI0033ECEBEB